jgi:hypothetical protein
MKGVKPVPISYQFINRETGTADTLSEVDRIICEKVGKEPDEINYSTPFIQVRTTGFCLTFSKENYTPSEVTELVEDNWKHMENLHQIVSLVDWALNEKWEFKSWR